MNQVAVLATIVWKARMTAAVVAQSVLPIHGHVDSNPPIVVLLVVWIAMRSMGKEYTTPEKSYIVLIVYHMAQRCGRR